MKDREQRKLNGVLHKQGDMSKEKNMSWRKRNNTLWHRMAKKQETRQKD